jgi:hypothetical protein
VIVRKILNLVAGIAIAAGLNGTAQANRPPKVQYTDIALQTGADGRKTSGIFAINIRSSQSGRPDTTTPARLFVRDSNVATSRGPRDRVCVKLESDATRVPELAIAPAGSGPGPHLMWGDRPVRATLQCTLLPAADRYRVWSLSGKHLEMDGNIPRWAAPAVFGQLEDMGNQEQPVVIGRNIEKIANSLKLDTLCVEVSVLRATFSAPDNVPRQTKWAQQQSALSSLIGAVSRKSWDYAFQQSKVRENGYYRTPNHYDLLNQGAEDTEAFAVPFRFGFSSLENLEQRNAAVKLDRESGWPLLGTFKDCFGDPDSNGDPIKLPVVGLDSPIVSYGHISIAMVLPFWDDYAQGSPAAQSYWRKYYHTVALHELVHVHDFLVTMNEAVFQAKGRADLQRDIIATTGETTEIWQLGLRIYPGSEPSPDWSAFQSVETVMKNTTEVSVMYFHNALYNPDQNGVATTDYDIWFQPHIRFRPGQ